MGNILSGQQRRFIVNTGMRIGMALVAVMVVGCATMPPPGGPSAYAQSVVPITKRNAARVPQCMQVAAEASRQVQQQNMGNQVAGAVVGGVLGGLAGVAVSRPTSAYVGRPRVYGYTRYGRPVIGRRIIRVPGQNLAGIGAIGGAAAGAALMGGAQQNPQQVYDTAYLQCMQGK